MPANWTRNVLRHTACRCSGPHFGFECGFALTEACEVSTRAPWAARSGDDMKGPGTMKKILTALLAAAGLTLAAAGPSAAPEKEAAVGAQVTAKATVETVDMATRHVLLRAEDGSLQTVTVGPEVRNLAQVKPGDHVLVRVRLGVVAQIAPPHDDAPPVAAADIAGRAPEGARPAGLVGDAVRARVTFNSYDRRTKVVRFTLPDGVEKTGALQTKTMQDFAAGLKPGNKVDLTFIRSLAIAVEPSA